MNQDEWIKDGPILTAPQVLDRLRRTIENESALVVEHRFYRGARAPHRFVCDDYDDLAAYIATQTSAGDAFLLWRFEDCCTDKTAMASGKIPDVEGRVPRGGAY